MIVDKQVVVLAVVHYARVEQPVAIDVERLHQSRFFFLNIVNCFYLN